MSSKTVLGYVMHISKGSGNLILKAEADARIGQNVFDKRGNKIGSVFDIFGPVENPYISVKTNDEPVNIKGKPLFLFKEKARKKKRKRKR